MAFLLNFCAHPAECEAYFSGVVKIFAFLELKPRLNVKYRFNWAKIDIFQKSPQLCTLQ